MRTRLSLFCDKVLEAGWLAALVIVPLFFNIFSQRVFEPDKLSLLRSLALVMSAFWIIRLLEDWRVRRQEGPPSQPSGAGQRWRRILRTPLVLPTLLLILVYMISTVMSVAPRVSFLGSYQRLQGTYTTLSYIVIFFVMLDGVRTRRQLDRVITTAVVVSFPIALYGLIQHFGVDPLPWGGNVTNRVASNMGNAIFVAAYLIMIVPLTLSRLLENWKEAAGSVDGRDVLRGLLAFALLVVALLAGMLIGRRTDQQWVRWVALALGIGLQVPVYLGSPTERRTRILAVALPLTFAFLVAFAWLMEIFLQAPKGSDLTRFFWMGLLAALVFILAMVAFAVYLRKSVARLLLLAAYAVILVAQLVCVFYTQSRGPWIGLAAGVMAYLAALGLVKRRLWLSWLMVGAGLLAVVVLVLFNTLQASWVEKLRETPYVGRAGKLLQTEQGTGKVRVLIWQGVVEMISPHAPLWSPVGSSGSTDRFNALRPVFGYGPESMYVAYNSFYPPDLAHFERRNASPDRSHNETFDALAMTGVVGFLVYMLVFTGVFYYALKWLGLIRMRWHGQSFVGLWIGGGLLGALATWLWRGPAYIGLGIPLGTMLGLAIFLLVCIIEGTARRAEGDAASGGYALWVLALFAAIVAHFVEIHFGIAIAATRTYFWVYTALLVVIGTRLSLSASASELAGAGNAEFEAKAATAVRPKVVRGPERPPAGSRSLSSRPSTGSRGSVERGKLRPRQAARRPERAAGPQPALARWLQAPDLDWWGSLLLWSLLVTLIIGTMLFDYVTPSATEKGPMSILWQALTQRQGNAPPAMLALLLGSWAMAGLLFISDLATREESARKAPRDWLRAMGLLVLISFVGALIFGLLHATRLEPIAISDPNAPNPLSSTIVDYYAFAFAIVLAGAAVLAFLFRGSTIPWRAGTDLADAAVILAGMVLPIAAGVLLARSNVTIVRADILYKQGLSAEKLQEWDSAIYLYDKAIDLAPKEDFYYLFLGRALMEKGQEADSQDRDAILRESEQALEKAREIAPLNTDHSANLARLYRTWGALDKDTGILSKALGFYADAIRLSPHNAQLRNEWGQTYAALGQYDQALQQYQQSLALDTQFVQTYQALGELYIDQENWAEAVWAYEQVVRLKPRDLASLKNLAVVYQKAGRDDDAIRTARQALELASDADKPALVRFILQLGGSLQDLTPAQDAELRRLIEQGQQQYESGDLSEAEVSFKLALGIDQQSIQAHSALALLYAQQGKLDEAIVENLAVLEWLPDNYVSYQNLALLYEKKNDSAKARDAASQALELAPDSEKPALQALLARLNRAGNLPPEQRNNMYQSAPPLTLDPTKSFQATIVTQKGKIVVALNAADAPQTVNNFVFLAQQGFYDGLTFHRVEHQSGFELIQGGDPTGTGTGGPGYTIPAEIGLPHKEGAIAMARLPDDVNPERASSGSQFYITLVPIPQLDGAYTVFGYVTYGLDVAKQIAVGDKILSVEIGVK